MAYDFVIDSHKLVIDIMNLNKKVNNQLEKFKNIQGTEYKYVQMFEDEWVVKNDICKSRIKSLVQVLINNIQENNNSTIIMNW